ncbi:MAG TPA: carbohydrate-binding protein [Nostocaceae cyanobacterium]|nr:carbohydrate-binding protein [Nostocaceae cyanobacterium]
MATTSKTTTQLVAFEQPEYQITESGNWLSVPIRVVRTGGSAGEISVKVSIRSDKKTGDSGTVGRDIEKLNQVLTWVDGDSTPKTVNISPVVDAFDEGEESLTLSLTSAKGAKIGTLKTAKLVIVDDELPIADLRDSTLTITAVTNRNSEPQKVKLNVFQLVRYVTEKAKEGLSINVNNLVKKTPAIIQFGGIELVEQGARVFPRSWAEIQVNFSQKPQGFTAYISNSGFQGLLEVRLGSPVGEVIGSTPVNGNQDFYQYYDIWFDTNKIKALEGKQLFYLVDKSPKIDYYVKEIELKLESGDLDHAFVINDKIVRFHKHGIKNIKVIAVENTNYDFSKGIEVQTWTSNPNQYNPSDNRIWLKKVNLNEYFSVELQQNSLPIVGLFAWDKKNNNYNSEGFWKACKISLEQDLETLILKIVG